MMKKKHLAKAGMTLLLFMRLGTNPSHDRSPPCMWGQKGSYDSERLALSIGMQEEAAIPRVSFGGFVLCFSQKC